MDTIFVSLKRSLPKFATPGGNTICNSCDPGSGDNNHCKPGSGENLGFDIEKEG